MALERKYTNKKKEIFIIILFIYFIVFSILILLSVIIHTVRLKV